ncbi:MAG: CHAT domain-containing tetratricopeptide repeat protein [bacterium]
MNQKRGYYLLFIISFFAFSLLFLPGRACLETEPGLLQQQAIKRIDGFIDHFRKTGDFTTRMYDLQLAERELKDSYEGFIKLGDLGSASLSLIKVGDIYRMQNQWDEAIRYYERAEKLAEKANHIAYQAKALMGHARAELYGTHDYGSAAAHIERAINLSSMIEDRTYLFDAFDFKAQIQITQGDLIAAADTLNLAFKLVEQGEIDDQTLLLYAYLDRADIYLKRAEKCDYLRAFGPCYAALDLAKEDYEQTLRIAKKLGYRGLAETTEGFLREVEGRRELIKKQENMHKQTVQLNVFNPKKPEDVLIHERFLSGENELAGGLIEWMKQNESVFGAGDARSFYIKGLFHEMQGENDDALKLYLMAVRLLEEDRGSLFDEKNRGLFLEDKIEFYYAPILHYLERRNFGEAFDLMERSRSRAMTDLLSSKRLEFSKPEDQSLYAESLRLKAKIASLQSELFGLRSRPEREKFAQQIVQKEKMIDDLQRDYAGLVNPDKGGSARIRKLMVSEPLSLKQLQQSMKEDDYEVLYYLLQESAVILWHIRKDEVRVRSVFLPRSELINKVDTLRKSLADRNKAFNLQTSSELFLLLVQPALQWIKTKHIVIIPHEDLYYIPFQIFYNPIEKRYFGEDYQISYAPNAALLVHLKKNMGIKGGRLLAAADPMINEAPDEVTGIGKLYGEDSRIMPTAHIREADLKAWADEYSVIHLAVHGYFNPQEPLLSYLKLKKDDRDDGDLTAAEMFGLPLEKARLVVLSACETGRATATHANELIGMQRALLFAGANNLVLSYWKVDSASTAIWMETFYGEAQHKSICEAARLALRRVKEDPKYTHPYYWGSFGVVGR